MSPDDNVDVLVVGGGPAGLAAAAVVRRVSGGRVMVVERDDTAGGVPRHSSHTGFGIRDLHRLMTGPAYARRIVERATALGVDVVTATMATGWSAPGEAQLTGPGSVRTVRARAIILATGARERPRTARLVPGDRPAGVLTTGELQQRVHIHHLDVGSRALVVGAEHVSYSAILTLRDAGVRTVGMVTALDRHQTVAVFAATAAVGLRVPLWTGTAVSAIRGRDRVEAVELTELRSGATRVVDVDTVVFTGNWIPDHELARRAGLTMVRASGGPEVDQLGHTSAAGVWAAGNLVHPGETADVAARRARRVGAAVAAWLGGPGATRRRVPVVVEAPLQWVSPGVVTPELGAVGRVIVRSDAFLARPVIVIEQGTRRLARHRLARAVPNRSHRIPGDWMAQVDPDGGPVRVRVDAR